MTPQRFRQAVSSLALLCLSLSVLGSWWVVRSSPKGALYALGPDEAQATLIRFQPGEKQPVLHLNGAEGVMDPKIQPSIQVVVTHEFLNRPVERALRWPSVIIAIAILANLGSYLAERRQNRHA